jgi:hypothetical protein
MKKLAFLAAALLVTACSSGDDGSESASANAFIGNWVCTKTLALKYTAPAGLPDATSSGTASITISAPSYGKLLVIIQNGDAGAPCNMNFHTASATQAAMDANQNCVDSGGISLTFTDGSAVSDGANKLTVGLNNGSFQTQVADDAGTSQAKGTGALSYVCTR